MVIIKVFGIDPYMLDKVSTDLTTKLAELYEIKKDEISFVATEGLFLHEGIDQSSYNIFIEVVAPSVLHDLEEDAFKIITNYMKIVVINIECVFNYFDIHHHHEYLNEEYPRFLTSPEISVESDEHEEEVLDDFEHDHIPSEDDLFLGNVFEGFEEKIKK